MAYITDTMFDVFLQYLIDNGSDLCICDTLPTDYTEATVTYMLGTTSLGDTGDYVGPANGDTSGRKVTIAAQSSISVTNSGTSAYIAIVDGSTTEELLAVFTCTAQVLTAGNTVNTTAFDLEVRDAADE